MVGLVIGGIWVATASIQQSQRVNSTAAEIIQIAEGARRLFSYSDYPTIWGSSIYAASTAAAAGVLPGDFKYVSGPFATSPMGALFSINLECYATCPMLAVLVTGPGHPTNPSTLTSSDCIQLIRRFAGLAKNDSDFLYVQVTTPTDSNFLFLYPPINPAAVNCPTNTKTIIFWFRP